MKRREFLAGIAASAIVSPALAQSVMSVQVGIVYDFNLMTTVRIIVPDKTAQLDQQQLAPNEKMIRMPLITYKAFGDPIALSASLNLDVPPVAVIVTPEG